MAAIGETENLTRGERIRRPIELLSLRLVPSLAAGTVASAAFFTLYYGTLALLTRTYVQLTEYHPFAGWYEKLDLAQFFGTIIVPPYATRLSWWVGFVVLFAILAATGAVFGIVLSWFFKKPSPSIGLLFGAGLFAAIIFPVSLGSGFDPAVMRQAVPDTGFMLLGWSALAPLQLFACSLLYGIVWTSLYALRVNAKSAF